MPRYNAITTSPIIGGHKFIYVEPATRTDTAEQKTSGVILAREIRGGVKVRTTNTTAATSTEAQDTIASVSGVLGTGNATTITAPTGQESHFVPGRFIATQEDTGGTNPFVLRFYTVVSRNNRSVTIERIDGGSSVNIATGALPQDVLVYSGLDEDPDFILLQNGPKGGFSQNIGLAPGVYRVNDVVDGLIFDA